MTKAGFEPTSSDYEPDKLPGYSISSFFFILLENIKEGTRTLNA